MYSLNKEIASYAVNNMLVQQLNKVSYKLGEELKTYGFYVPEYQKSEGVLDLCMFKALEDKEKKLVDEIVELRQKKYEQDGYVFSEVSAEMRKTLFYDYLLSVSACYIEVPKQITKESVKQNSYEKLLVTKNPNIMSSWSGEQANEMQAKYKAKITTTGQDLTDNVLKYVKLTSTKGKKSIVNARVGSLTTYMSCTPLFMLYAYQKGLEERLRKEILEVRYLKDNNTVRTLTTTLNEEIIKKYYSKEMSESMLALSDVDKEEVGSFKVGSRLNRGYIRVPELGSSMYDRSGVRALNITRLLTVKPTEKVDTEFITVDLDTTVPSFLMRLQQLKTENPEKIKEIYEEHLGKKVETEDLLEVLKSLINEVTTRNELLTTEYRRVLHRYMKSKEALFPQYTGKPCNISQLIEGTGVKPQTDEDLPMV